MPVQQSVHYQVRTKHRLLKFSYCTSQLEAHVLWSALNPQEYTLQIHQSTGRFILASSKLWSIYFVTCLRHKLDAGFTNWSIQDTHTGGQDADCSSQIWEDLGSSRAWLWPIIDPYSVVFAPKFLYFSRQNMMW